MSWKVYWADFTVGNMIALFFQNAFLISRQTDNILNQVQIVKALIKLFVTVDLLLDKKYCVSSSMYWFDFRSVSNGVKVAQSNKLLTFFYYSSNIRKKERKKAKSKYISWTDVQNFILLTKYNVQSIILVNKLNMR